MLSSVFLALALVHATHTVHGLDILAHLAIKNNHKLLVFKIENNSTKPQAFDEGSSPCAPNELVTVVFVGSGGIGKFIERDSLISDSGYRLRTILPHDYYECNFDVSIWFYDKMPFKRNAFLLWSFKPERDGVYNSKIYGGVFELSK